MAEMSEPIDIPNRPLFKAGEVCELLKVQPYVLRTWEAEFRDLGVARGAGGTRVYRREDVERVQRIKHMLLIEGLTLAGVRRKLEEESEPPLDETVLVPAPMGTETRQRILAVKEGLRSLLSLLDGRAPDTRGDASGDRTPVSDEFSLAPPDVSRDAERASQRSEAAERGKPRSPRRTRSA